MSKASDLRGKSGAGVPSYAEQPKAAPHPDASAVDSHKNPSSQGPNAAPVSKTQAVGGSKPTGRRPKV